MVASHTNPHCVQESNLQPFGLRADVLTTEQTSQGDLAVLKHAKYIPTSGPWHVLPLLPTVLFPQVTGWLAASQLQALALEPPSLDLLFKNARPPTPQHSPPPDVLATVHYLFWSPYHHDYLAPAFCLVCHFCISSA